MRPRPSRQPRRDRQRECNKHCAAAGVKPRQGNSRGLQVADRRIDARTKTRSSPGRNSDMRKKHADQSLITDVQQASPPPLRNHRTPSLRRSMKRRQEGAQGNRIWNSSAALGGFCDIGRDGFYRVADDSRRGRLFWIALSNAGRVWTTRGGETPRCTTFMRFWR